jgi:hypothetical protein
MASTHHHHGGLSRLIVPFRAIYHKWYVPGLVWLGNAMGGRTRAGRLGRASRVTRLLGNLLTLSAIIAFIAIVGFTAFWTGGAALPVWAAVLVAAGITLNSAGLVIGAAANHLKIEQYYDAELELHADNNELRSDSEKTELPHGLHAPARKLLMSGVRYSHDVNGAAGTASSWTSSILEAITWLSAGLITFEPVVGSALFVASRGSAIISATGAVGTNQHRLWVYRKSVDEKIAEHYQLKEASNKDRHQLIKKMVSETFSTLNIQEGYKYTPWVQFRCYKAVDTAMKKHVSKIEDGKIKDALSDALKPFLKEEKSWWQKYIAIFTAPSAFSAKQRFSRQALMNMESPSGFKLSVLDSMPVLEHRLFNAVSSKINTETHVLISHAVDSFSSEYLATGKDSVASLFIFHLKQALIEQSSSGVTKEIIYEIFINNFSHFFIELAVDKKYQYALNKKTLSDFYPLLGNPHGNQFLVDYHTKKIAQDISCRIKEKLTSRKTSDVFANASAPIMRKEAGLPKGRNSDPIAPIPITDPKRFSPEPMLRRDKILE